MIDKLTSINVVINKIIRDLGLENEEIPFHNYVEWIAEALEHIGSYAQFTEKETVLTVENYVAIFPCDYHNLIQLKYPTSLKCCAVSGYKPAVVARALDSLNLRDDKNQPVITPEAFRIVQMAGGYKGNPYKIQDNLRSNEGLMSEMSVDTDISITENNYSVQHGHVRTAFQDGFIVMKYLAMPMDCDGFPLIPDEVSFMEALFWKVCEKLRMRGKMFSAPEMNDLHFLKSEWRTYCMQARGKANMPDLETLDQLAQSWNTLIKNYNEFGQDFATNGRTETLNYNIDGRYTGVQ